MTLLTTASAGVVELAGNSLASVSDTCRTVELAGSTVESVPPQEIFRNGAPSASSTTTITLAKATGRRITLCARRYQAPPSSFGAAPTLLRTRSALTRWPSTASSAGSTVTAAMTTTATVATPP